ncbi:MAG TPA: integrase core domain-containing protein, partial [Herpetosiphonaceae bacterium]|nr:integrase core domain-containing protein [Herpetosiphonaceae bacterium]
MFGILKRVGSIIEQGLRAASNIISRWTKPISYAPAVAVVADLARSKSDLIAENLLLRQQLIVLNRSVKRPRFMPIERGLFVLLASKIQHWKDALLIIKPETVLRWHRAGFRLFWKRKSRVRSYAPKLPTETITLIKEMATNNHLWGAERIRGELLKVGIKGAERIRGELLKVGIKVAKRTIQRYMRQARPSRPHGQTWATFLRNHAKEIWACDFLQIHDLFFRPLFAFIITELGSRRIVHVGVTRTPTDDWVAQQLREATPFGQAPKYLVRDNDAKYGAHFEAVATGTGIEVLQTPIRAPRANAICERLLGSVRRECLDHMLIVGAEHLRRVLKEYMTYFNRSRPHQGSEQRVPEPDEGSVPPTGIGGNVIAFPVLGGLHHEY